LLGYQWLTTLDKEVLLFWKRRFTGASALFFFIRYSALISYGILSFITYAPLSDSVPICSCAMLVRAQATLVMFQYLPWAAFAALRVLALSGMRWTLAAVVLVLSLGAPVVNFMQWGYNLTGINVPFVGCSSSVSASAQTHLMCVVLILRGSSGSDMTQM
ncbi:hypothetical protein BD413DRAFT_482185, partial [Trametes elegans]